MLEVRIEELTKAVRDLTEVLKNRPPAPSPLVIKDATQMCSAGASPVLTVNGLPNALPKSEPTPGTSQASSTESDPVTYEDVKRITIAVGAKDKPKAVAALARFGVTSAKGLKEDQWGEYVSYMEKVVAGEVDPEASE